MDSEHDGLRGAREWVGGWPQTAYEFERLVDVFQHRLVRYAFRCLRNLEEAEDVAQEVFVRAYFDNTRHKTIRNVSAYLYRIASNLCTDVLRRRKRRRRDIALELRRHREGQALQDPTNRPNGLVAVAAAEAQRRIDGLLRRIPQRQAEVIRLRVFDELRLGEIAEVLGCSLATVKSRLRYGLEKLRTIVPSGQGVSG
jgi:RNA polymerase sigma-70 factor (ECF subfamily)